MAWDYNFLFPNNNVFHPQITENNIKYDARTISVKWWDKFTYERKRIDTITPNQLLQTYNLKKES